MAKVFSGKSICIQIDDGDSVLCNLSEVGEKIKGELPSGWKMGINATKKSKKTFYLEPNSDEKIFNFIQLHEHLQGSPYEKSGIRFPFGVDLLLDDCIRFSELWGYLKSTDNWYEEKISQEEIHFAEPEGNHSISLGSKKYQSREELLKTFSKKAENDPRLMKDFQAWLLERQKQTPRKKGHKSLRMKSPQGPFGSAKKQKVNPGDNAVDSEPTLVKTPTVTRNLGDNEDQDPPIQTFQFKDIMRYLKNKHNYRYNHAGPLGDFCYVAGWGNKKKDKGVFWTQEDLLNYIEKGDYHKDDWGLKKNFLQWAKQNNVAPNEQRVDKEAESLSRLGKEKGRNSHQEEEQGEQPQKGKLSEKYKFNGQIWHFLRGLGWSYGPGNLSCTYFYYPPNTVKKTAQHKKDLFCSEEEVMEHLESSVELRKQFLAWVEKEKEPGKTHKRRKSQNSKQNIKQEDDTSEGSGVEEDPAEWISTVVTHHVNLSDYTFKDLWRFLKKKLWTWTNGGLYDFLYLKPGADKHGEIGKDIFSTPEQIMDYVESNLELKQEFYSDMARSGNFRGLSRFKKADKISKKPTKSQPQAQKRRKTAKKGTCGLCSTKGFYGGRDLDTLFECRRCKMVCHPGCYFPRFPPQSHSAYLFTCDLCSAENDNASEVRCELCLDTEGIGWKQTLESKWIHIICYHAACPEVFSEDPISLWPIKGVPAAIRKAQAIFGAKCEVCQKIGGYPGTCSFKSCRVLFHTHCAVYEGYPYRQKPHSASHQAFCRKHIPEELVCPICGGSEEKGLLLECEECLFGFHLDCLDPPLEKVPTGRWICTSCTEHQVELGNVLPQTIKPEVEIKNEDLNCTPMADKYQLVDCSSGGDPPTIKGAVKSTPRRVKNGTSQNQALRLPFLELEGGFLSEEEGSDSDDAQSEEADEESKGLPNTFVDVNLGAQVYFDGRKKDRRSSTKRVFSIPDDIQTSFSNYKDILQEIKRRKHGHEQERAALIKSYSESFWSWHTKLLCGFNLMFYGFGSKKKLLELFAKQELKDGQCVIIDGNGEVVSITGLMDYLTKVIFKIRRSEHEPWSNLLYSASRVIEAIKAQRKLNEEEMELVSSSGRRLSKIHDAQQPPPIRRLYLIIHNIDNPRLNSDNAKNVLSLLAASEHIHVAASVDHINAPFLWDTALAERFNWVWKDTTTFASYSSELMTRCQSVLSKQAKGAGLTQIAVEKEGLKFVLESITPHHKDMLRVIADYMLQDPAHMKGMPKSNFEEQCLRKLIVGSRSALSPYLKELTDHDLIKEYKPDPMGQMNITIPKEKGTIEYIFHLTSEKKK